MNDNVIYLEADEEITAAIDRMIKNPAVEVKIVVPKRSTLLQSVVNLKLLKKAADDAGKKLVLVTGDRTSTHIAGQLGLAVAATLTSQSAVPRPKPPVPEASDEIEAGDDDDEAEAAAGAAGAQAASTVVAGPKVGSNKPSYAKPMMVRKAASEADDETMDDGGGNESDTQEFKSGKKPRVPDFNKMQKRLLWVGLAVVVLVLLGIVNYFITSGTVTLYVQGSAVPTSFTATLDPTTKTTTPASSTLAATNLSSSHSLSENVAATGTQDVGTKAGGSITVNNCFDNNSHTFAAGTSFVSAGGLSFVSTADVTVPGGNVNILGCVKAGSAAVNVTASANGDQYNLASGTKYTISGLASSMQPYISGVGNQMSGGTTKTVSVVAQADIDKAVTDLLTKDKDTSQKDLENKAGSGNRAISVSFAQIQGTVTSNPVVGAQADQTAVTVQVNYTELAVSNADLDKVLTAQELQQAGANSQIYDDGVGSLTITAVKNVPNAASTFTFDTTAYGGGKLDPAAIAKQLVGKKYGDAADTASGLPGVTKADVSLSPFWATSLPHISSHIHISIKVIKQ